MTKAEEINEYILKDRNRVCICSTLLFFKFSGRNFERGLDGSKILVGFWKNSKAIRFLQLEI